MCLAVRSVRGMLCACRLWRGGGDHVVSQRRQLAAVRRVFDRDVKRLQRDRAEFAADPALYDYLKAEVGWRVADRVRDVRRTFDTALDLGCGRGHVMRHLDAETVSRVLACDMSAGQLRAASCPDGVQLERRCEDEEQLQLPDSSVQLAVSSMSLHWVNDLSGALGRVHAALQPDSPLVGACLGVETLYELRASLQLACLERRGGVGVHLSPLLRPVDVTTLLSQADFSLVTVDIDSITVRYPSMFELLWDLQGMAESNAVLERSVHVGRDTLMAAAAIYREMYGDDEGVPATFHVIHFIGWKAGPDQQQPLPRGSGKFSLKELASVLQQPEPGRP